MNSFFRRVFTAWSFFVVALTCGWLNAQGPAPETAPPLFPGGTLVSYSSVFTSRGAPSSGSIASTDRPTLTHEGDFNFTWGFHANFDLTLVVPIVTNEFRMNGNSTISGTGLGDVIGSVKYRFYRRDSDRGTTQASFTIGPKLPTGRTDLLDHGGDLLPTSLQPGSGSTDFFAGANWTYTGLFGIRRLVADEDFHSLLRSQGSQRTRLGDDFESRFWLSYRPYESKDVAREWFIGPELTWMGSTDDHISGVTASGSGGQNLLAGVTTYVGVRPGMHVWLGADWSIAHSRSPEYMPPRRHISFGITQQFRLHF